MTCPYWYETGFLTRWTSLASSSGRRPFGLRKTFHTVSGIMMYEVEVEADWYLKGVDCFKSVIYTCQRPRGNPSILRATPFNHFTTDPWFCSYQYTDYKCLHSKVEGGVCCWWLKNEEIIIMKKEKMLLLLCDNKLDFYSSQFSFLDFVSFSTLFHLLFLSSYFFLLSFLLRPYTFSVIFFIRNLLNPRSQGCVLFNFVGLNLKYFSL